MVRKRLTKEKVIPEDLRRLNSSVRVSYNVKTREPDAVADQCSLIFKQDNCGNLLQGMFKLMINHDNHLICYILIGRQHLDLQECYF